MPTANNITVAGAVRLAGLPEDACFETFEELLQALVKYLVLDLPETITNVIVSQTQPTDAQKTSVWIRTDGSGAVIGLYIFSAGNWNQVVPAPQQLIWMYGDSTEIPNGYVLADASNPHITAAEAIHLATLWYPVGGPTYSIFQVTYEGT